MDRTSRVSRFPAYRDWLDGKWSPNGKEIAFVRNGHLHVVNLRSGSVRSLTAGGHNRPDVQDPVWSPDGRRIVFARRDGRLWSVKSKGGCLRPLTAASTRKADMESAYAPDGRYIAFSRGYYGKTHSVEGFPIMLSHQILILNTLTGKVMPLTKRFDQRSDGCPQWFRDGHSVIFVRNAQLAFAGL